jgi:hypothetical protein
MTCGVTVAVFGTLTGSSLGGMCPSPEHPESMAEIEVTPEMIKAGVGAFRLYESGDDWASTVEDIYRAMEEVRRAGLFVASLAPRPCSQSPSRANRATGCYE